MSVDVPPTAGSTTAEFIAEPALMPQVAASAVGYRMSTPAQEIHRGLPSPTLTFIISLARPIVTGESVDHARSPEAYRNDVIVSGLHTRPAYIDQQGDEAGLQLAIRPTAARALFGLPTAELRSLTTEGTDVLGRPVAELRDQLIEASTWGERFDVMQAFLRSRVGAEPSSTPRAEMTEAWREIARTGGTISMTALARHVLLSQRQLNALFRAEFGISPKAASRLTRFDRTRQLITAADGSEDLSRIAQRCGYYDHSHLVREFREFVGASPTAWLTEERQNIQAGSAGGRADYPV